MALCTYLKTTCGCLATIDYCIIIALFVAPFVLMFLHYLLNPFSNYVLFNSVTSTPNIRFYKIERLQCRITKYILNDFSTDSNHVLNYFL